MIILILSILVAILIFFFLYDLRYLRSAYPDHQRYIDLFKRNPYLVENDELFEWIEKNKKDWWTIHEKLGFFNKNTREEHHIKTEKKLDEDRIDKGSPLKHQYFPYTGFYRIISKTENDLKEELARSQENEKLLKKSLIKDIKEQQEDRLQLKNTELKNKIKKLKNDN